MAAIEKGGTAYAWGVDATATIPISVTSFSISEKFGVEAFVEDENGVRKAMRLDDPEYELSLEGTLKTSGTVPEIGTNITYRTHTFIIKEIETRGEAKGYTKIAVKGSKYSGFSV